MFIIYINALHIGILLMALSGLLTGCDSKPSGAELFALPESLAEPIEMAGTKFQALAYANRPLVNITFAVDLLGAGLLPVRISVDNRAGHLVKIMPRQTFLIDLEGQAWPMLTSTQAFSRLQVADMTTAVGSALTATDDLESFTGFALSIATGRDFSADVRANSKTETWAGKSLLERQLRNPRIPAGQVASGVLYFPGRNEATSARSLRLCLEQDGQLKFLKLPLKNPMSNAQAP